MLQHYTIKRTEVKGMVIRFLKGSVLLGLLILVGLAVSVVLDFRNKVADGYWAGMIEENSHIEYMHGAVDDLDKDIHRAIEHITNLDDIWKQRHGSTQHHLHTADGQIIWQDEWIVTDPSELP